MFQKSALYCYRVVRIIGHKGMYLEIISHTDKNWLAEKLSKNIHLKDTCKWCDIVFLI